MTALVSNRSVYGGNAQSDGILTSTTFMSRHVAARAVTSLQLTYINAAGATDIGVNSVNYKCSIQYPAGTQPVPVSFAGVRTKAIASGASATSDSCTIAIPAGGVFYVRTNVSVTAGGKWVANATIDGSTWGEGLTASVDLTDVPTAMGVMSDASYLIAPMVITNGDSATVPSLLMLGDSIIRSTGETGFFDRGYGMRACNRGITGAYIPFMNLAYPGETVTGFIGGANGLVRKALAQNIPARDVLIAYGSNDLTAGRSGAQVIADLTTLANTLIGWGYRVSASTILPRTTSTDSWATTTNQTPVSGFAVGSERDTVNTYLRTLPSPFSFIVDASDAVESYRGSGVWKAGFTADGTHPTTAGHILMAKQIPISQYATATTTAQVVG